MPAMWTRCITSASFTTTCNLKTAIAWYLKAHEKGHATAAYELGRLYRAGIDANRDMQDLDRAISVLEAAFERKHEDAGDELGLIYQEKGDTSKAMEWFQKALDRPAYKKLSPLFNLLDESKSPGDKERALEVLRTCAERGSVSAMLLLGSSYKAGIRGAKADPALAFEWFKRALQDEPSAADFYVAECYVKGSGTDIDINAASKHYRRAVEVHDYRALAAAPLGHMYFNGKGAPVDSDEALKYWRMVITEGMSGCAVPIGQCYELGRGVPRDEAEAVKWYTQEQDYDEYALMHLSRCARLGVGMAKDLGKAIDFLRQAVSEDFDGEYPAEECYCLLALRLKEHHGAERDVEECLRLLQRSAKGESAAGRYYLGRAYETGDGVVPDTAQAMRWYEKAADLGFRPAKVEIGRHLFYGIGHTQRDEAKAFSVCWRRRRGAVAPPSTWRGATRAASAASSGARRRQRSGAKRQRISVLTANRV